MFAEEMLDGVGAAQNRRVGGCAQILGNEEEVWFLLEAFADPFDLRAEPETDQIYRDIVTPREPQACPGLGRIGHAIVIGADLQRHDELLDRGRFQVPLVGPK
jgi:hypothetical protein